MKKDRLLGWVRGLWWVALITALITLELCGVINMGWNVLLLMLAIPMVGVVLTFMGMGWLGIVLLFLFKTKSWGHLIDIVDQWVEQYNRGSWKNLQ